MNLLDFQTSRGFFYADVVNICSPSGVSNWESTDLKHVVLHWQFDPLVDSFSDPEAADITVPLSACPPGTVSLC